jgi:hypothetical protein
MRGTDASKLDPKAGQLWNSWVEWETKMANHKGVATVYARLMASEGPYVETQWIKFKMYASFRPLHELYLDDADEQRVRSHATKLKAATDDPALTENELRSALLTLRENYAKASIAAASMRKPFENALGKRTYFHVKPLDAPTLQAWRNYLNFEEQLALKSTGADGARDKQAVDRVEQLYGRCLVACANYTEFWMRYAAWKLKLGSGVSDAATDDCITVMGQAVTTFTPRRVDAHLLYCVLLESSGRQEYVESYFRSLLSEGSWCHTSVELKLRYANFLRRTGKSSDALAYIQGLAAAEDAQTSVTLKTALQSACLKAWQLANKPAAPETVPAFVAEKRAQFETFVGATPTSANMWLTYIDSERQLLLSGAVNSDFSSMHAIYQRATGAALAAESIAMLYLTWVDDADLFGNALQLQEVIFGYRAWYAEYIGQMLLHGSAVDNAELLASSTAPAIRQTGLQMDAEERARDSLAGHKRPANEAGLAAADGSNSKVPRTDEAAVPQQADASAAANYAQYYNTTGYPQQSTADATAAQAATATAANPYAAYQQYYGAYGQYPQAGYPQQQAYGGYNAAAGYRQY